MNIRLSHPGFILFPQKKIQAPYPKSKHLSEHFRNYNFEITNWYIDGATEHYEVKKKKKLNFTSFKMNVMQYESQLWLIMEFRDENSQITKRRNLFSLPPHLIFLNLKFCPSSTCTYKCLPRSPYQKNYPPNCLQTQKLLSPS